MWNRHFCAVRVDEDRLCIVATVHQMVLVNTQTFFGENIDISIFGYNTVSLVPF